MRQLSTQSDTPLQKVKRTSSFALRQATTYNTYKMAWLSHIWCMAFIRVRYGKYIYHEQRYREGGEVRSKSRYLGKVGGSLFKPKRHAPLLSDEGWAERQQELQAREDRAVESALRNAEKDRLRYEKEKAAKAAERERIEEQDRKITDEAVEKSSPGEGEQGTTPGEGVSPSGQGEATEGEE